MTDREKLEKALQLIMESVEDSLESEAYIAYHLKKARGHIRVALCELPQPKRFFMYYDNEASCPYVFLKDRQSNEAHIYAHSVKWGGDDRMKEICDLLNKGHEATEVSGPPFETVADLRKWLYEGLDEATEAER